MRIAALIVFTLVAAGCTGGLSGGGNGLDRVVMKTTNADIVPPARGYLGLAVRSFAGGGDGEWQEVAGARCVASAGAFGAVLTTPSQLVVPDLGPDAVPVTVECTKGASSGRGVSMPDFSWKGSDKPSPPARIAYGGGWWYGYRKSGPLAFPDIDVGLR
jgi:hypothetical protein